MFDTFPGRLAWTEISAWSSGKRRVMRETPTPRSLGGCPSVGIDEVQGKLREENEDLARQTAEGQQRSREGGSVLGRVERIIRR